MMAMRMAWLAVIGVVWMTASVGFAEPERGDAADRKELVTRYWDLPPMCSFDSPEDRSPRPSAQDILERAGVVFGSGSSVRRLDVGAGRLLVRNTREQMALVQAYFDSLKDDGARQVTVIVEFIETERSILNEWLLENRFDSDGTPLRQMLQAKAREGEARIVETTVIAARSGQRARIESVSEFSYPVDFYMGDLPPAAENTTTNSKVPGLLGRLMAYETRNLGMTLEVDPVVGADGTTVDVHFDSDSVALVAYSTWPKKDFDPQAQERTPDFYTMELVSAVVVSDGNYALIGTLRPRKAIQEGIDDPIVIGFVRVDVSDGRRG